MGEEREDPVELAITDVFDLHSIRPRDAQAAVEAYLEEAKRKGWRAVRIIHGRGIGVQREMVRKVLAGTPFVTFFADAPAEAGGWGATIVNLGEERPAMLSELERLGKEYDEALSEACRLVEGLTAEQMNWRESAESWSLGQCLDHLALVGRLYAGRIGAAVEEGQRNKVYGEGPFRYGWLERWFLRLTEPPPRFRMKAPRVFRPAQQQVAPDAAGTVERYREANRALRELVDRAKGLDWKKLRVGSPVSEGVKMSLGIALAGGAAHERRHIHQMRRILATAGFPAG